MHSLCEWGVITVTISARTLTSRSFTQSDFQNMGTNSAWIDWFICLTTQPKPKLSITRPLPQWTTPPLPPAALRSPLALHSTRTTLPMTSAMLLSRPIWESSIVFMARRAGLEGLRCEFGNGGITYVWCFLTVACTCILKRISEAHSVGNPWLWCKLDCPS